MKSEKRFSMKLLAISLAVVLVGACAGVTLANSLMYPKAADAETLTSLTGLAATSSELDSPFKAVYAQASQSIVGIRLASQMQVMNGRIVNDASFVGSGVVISNDGYVVTNYHVVTGSSRSGATVAESIWVIYQDEEYEATYVAGDESSDIAILKVEGLNAPAAKIGNSDELSVGDWALVIGNPLDETLVNTLTVGVISGMNRDVASMGRSSSTSTSTSQTEMIQTNAAINSGNSGGGLFNIRGELVGITSAKLSNNGYYGTASIEGVGLAIPINTVSKIADDLIEHGQVRYPRIGIGTNDLKTGSDEPTKDSLPNSVWVRSVEKGSPADAVGVKVNDLIVEVDGQRVTTATELQSIIRAHEIGETVQITVYRIPNISNIKQNEPIPDGEYITFDIEVQYID